MPQFKSVDEILEYLERNPIEEGGQLYHPIPFPEFQNIGTSTDRESSMNKLGIVLANVEKIYSDYDGLKVLDVGANGGLYSFSFAERGAEVVSFEPDAKYSMIAESLIRLKGISNMVWYNEPLSTARIESESFDVALMLSVFQWMASGGGTFRKLAIC